MAEHTENAVTPPSVGASGSGAAYWAVGFAAASDLPLAPIIAAALYNGEKHNPNPVTRENARWSLNWQLTFLIFQAVLFIPFVAYPVVCYTLDFPVGSGITFGVWVLMTLGLLYHLVITILGMVRGQREVFRPPLTIPFVK